MVNKKSKIRRRGIYLLPNLFTTGAMFAGYYSITSAINHRFETAAITLFVAMILDGLDGRVARLTHTESEFGVEYDSLSDMVSFGVAPAMLMYLWALGDLGRMGLFAAFVHMAGGALRLARFNTQVATADKHFFQGLPSPAAAAILAGFVWMSVEYGYDIGSISYLALILTILTGLLMVSNFRYYSFKKIEIHDRVPFVAAIAIMLGIAFIMTQPQDMLFILAIAYMVSGPLVTLVMRRRKRRGRKV